MLPLATERILKVGVLVAHSGTLLIGWRRVRHLDGSSLGCHLKEPALREGASNFNT